MAVALIATLPVDPSPSGVAQAQEDRTTLEPIVDAPLPVPKLRCSLDRLYGKVKFESFLIEANYSKCKGADKNPKDYFIDEFVDALKNVRRGTGYEVTRVTAPAGYGKSALFHYLKGILEKKVNGRRPDEIRVELDDPAFNIDDHVAWVSLENLATRFDVRSIMLDELQNEDGLSIPAFAKLGAFDYDEHAAPGVEFLVRAFNPRFGNTKLDRLILLIDSIDEIHPESAKSLLVRIDDYIKHRGEEDKRPGSREGFLRIFVIGRPEGFTGYYRITQGGVYKTRSVKLKKPDFQTDCDREEAAESVAQFVLGDEKGEWSSKTNSMASIAITFISTHEWLKDSFDNLMLLNDLVKISNDYKEKTGSAIGGNDFELKEIFFQSLLGRARASHNRPSWQSQKYVELLEKIAAMYCGKRVEGYFVVTPSDSVEIEVTVDGHRHKVSYLVESVLNRSGVAELDSEYLYTPRYRFHPAWVHDHLVTREREMDKRRNKAQR